MLPWDDQYAYTRTQYAGQTQGAASSGQKNEDGSEEEGGAGVIIGIVVGTVVGLFCCGASVVYAYKKSSAHIETAGSTGASGIQTQGAVGTIGTAQTSSVAAYATTETAVVGTAPIRNEPQVKYSMSTHAYDVYML